MNFKSGIIAMFQRIKAHRKTDQYYDAAERGQWVNDGRRSVSNLEPLVHDSLVALEVIDESGKIWPYITEALELANVKNESRGRWQEWRADHNDINPPMVETNKDGKAVLTRKWCEFVRNRTLPLVAKCVRELLPEVKEKIELCVSPLRTGKLEVKTFTKHGERVHGAEVVVPCHWRSRVHGRGLAVVDGCFVITAKRQSEFGCPREVYSVRCLKRTRGRVFKRFTGTIVKENGEAHFVGVMKLVEPKVQDAAKGDQSHA